MNKNARTLCLETLLNDSELSGLEKVAQMLGIPKSTLNRGWINERVQQHLMGPPPVRESRGCRGAGRPASRAEAFMSKRRQV